MSNIMAESASTLSTSEFSHCNLVDVPSLTNPFIAKMAGENLPVKVTLTSGYKLSQESYLHDVEGKPPTVSALSVIPQESLFVPLPIEVLSLVETMVNFFIFHS